MMNREQMIEKAAVAITDYLDPVREKKHSGEYDEFDYGQASAVVDVVLPQVTTVEEMEALPALSVVACECCGMVFIRSLDWPWLDPANTILDHDEVALHEPLTVVWQP